MIRGEWWTKDKIDAELEALQREYAEDEAVIREMGEQAIRDILAGRQPAKE